jgi:hypothetical protein
VVPDGSDPPIRSPLMSDTTAPATPDRRPALIVLAVILAIALAGGGYAAGRASKSGGKAAATGATGSAGKGLQLGALGKVVSVNGTTVILKTRNGQRNITLNDQTAVLTATPAPGTKIQPGENLVVESKRDSGGKLIAIRIVVLPSQ